MSHAGPVSEDTNAKTSQTPEAEGKDTTQGAPAGKTGESLVTVIVALVANGVLAAAKTVAGLLSGSSSMIAEAAHSWSDTGNEIFLLVAERKGAKPRDRSHPRGYGRATYIWSLVAAFGLFSAGALVSIIQGVSRLLSPSGDGGSFTLNYIVLAVAFVLEGASFFQASRQVRAAASTLQLHPLRYVSRTSNATLRAVFFEDFSALVGLLIAASGIGLHQLTGEAAWDAIGSILIGVLLAVVAIFLMQRNMEYLLGEAQGDEVRARVLRLLGEQHEIAKTTYVHIEFVGPQRVFVVAAVDLQGDDPESSLAGRLRDVEHRIEQDPFIEDIVLTLSQPDDPALTV